MTKREHELREARRCGGVAVAALAIAVLQGFAHHLWVMAGALLLAVLTGMAAAGFWLAAREAEPWEEPDPPKRPWRLWLVLDFGAAALAPVCALLALLRGHHLDAASWTLWTAVMVHMARDTLRLRRITAPVKVLARPGPREEWL